MSKFRSGSKAQPFPVRRPPITIAASRARPFSVDFREIWFGTIPKPGHRALQAWYDPPDWRLTGVSSSEVVGPALIHDVEGLEVTVDSWEPESGWGPDRTFYCRLTERTVEFLAQDYVHEGKRRLYTFLDDGFDSDFGGHFRKIRNKGRLALRKDGSFRLRGSGRAGPLEVIGAGVFRLKVGRKQFTCLRAMEIYEWQHPLEARSLLVETYLTREGRTVISRRYNGRLWATRKGTFAGPPWDERFPENERIVINGATFVHWYDVLSDFACGIKWPAR